LGYFKKINVIEKPKEKNKDEFQGILHAFKIAQITSVLDWLKEHKTYFM